MNKKVQKRKGLIDEFAERYGETVIWKVGASLYREKVDTLPTDSVAINWAIGGTGLPRGRMTELYGPEHSGKTTICYHAIACCQRSGKQAALIDLENSMDPVYAKRCGIDMPKLFIAQPDWGEQALSILEDLITDKRTDLIVLDSVAQLSPKAEIEGDIGDSHMGLQARMITQAMRRITGLLKVSDTAVVFTNQLRDKIGGYGYESTPGGHGLKHAFSVRARISRGEPIKIKGEPIGYMAKIDVKKNKIVSPFRKVEFPVLYGIGIETRLELITLAVKAGTMSKKGAYYYLGNRKRSVGSGWKTAYDFLVSSKLKGRVEERVYNYLNSLVVDFEESDEDKKAKANSKKA